MNLTGDHAVTLQRSCSMRRNRQKEYQVVSAYIRGQYEAFNRVLNLLQSTEQYIERKELYKIIMDMRPTTEI